MITFCIPEEKDLWFREEMLSDAQTMAYNHAYGTTIPFGKEKWDSWYKRWLIHHEGKRFYRYIASQGVFVGEASYHLDEAVGRYLIDILICAPYRYRGYGNLALEELCRVAKANGIDTVYDHIATDNPSISLFVRNGFKEISSDSTGIWMRKTLCTEDHEQDQN